MSQLKSLPLPPNTCQLISCRPPTPSFLLKYWDILTSFCSLSPRTCLYFHRWMLETPDARVPGCSVQRLLVLLDPGKRCTGGRPLVVFLQSLTEAVEPLLVALNVLSLSCPVLRCIPGTYTGLFEFVESWIRLLLVVAGLVSCYGILPVIFDSIRLLMLLMDLITFSVSNHDSQS